MERSMSVATIGRTVVVGAYLVAVAIAGRPVWLAVLRKVVARRRIGVIELGDLPPECRTTTKRMLTPLESLECDAIVEALLDSGGNKVEAARSLAMSRATIYRKIRDFGISVPGTAEPIR